MAFQVIDYTGRATSPNPMISALSQILEQRRAEAMAKPMRDAQLAQMQARTGLEQAQTEAARKKASLPFGGEIAPGTVGQQMYLQRIAEDPRYGPQSELYKRTKAALDQEAAQVQQRMDYQKQLAETLGRRSTSALGKSVLEQQDILAGRLPGQLPLQATPTQALSPQEAQQAIQQYALQRQKTTTDADTRRRSLFAQNMEKTIANFNPEDLVRYSGLKGGAEKTKEMISAQFGKESPEYDKYQSALTNVKILAKQIRQFFGDSIQEGARKDLQDITNPSTWTSTPKIALEKYNSLVNLLRNEMQTYNDALQKRDPYLGHSQTRQRQDERAQVLHYDPKTGRFT